MSVLNQLFNRGLLGTKCKTCLNLAIARIKLLQNKRQVQLYQMRKEIAQFLQTGQEPIARIRVEHIIREMNMQAVYEILELFCEFVYARVPILETQKECPRELQEAISSIIFASPRCSDVPELLQVSNLFSAKYGKEFASAAAELRPGTSVNRVIIEKLSVRAPAAEVKLRVLMDIAQEYSLDWDSSNTRKEFSKKHEDLLDGSSRACSGAIKSQSPIVGVSPDISQLNKSGPPIPNNRIQQSQRLEVAGVAISNMSLATPNKTQATNGSDKDGSTPDAKTKASSDSSNIMEIARAAIASADRATAAARRAAQLVNAKNQLS